MLDLVKVEDQTGYCREIYKDINTSILYCRHINNKLSKGVYVNFWNTFTSEPDCPLKDGTLIRIGSEAFVIERDEYTDWAIEKKVGRDFLKIVLNSMNKEQLVSLLYAYDAYIIDIVEDLPFNMVDRVPVCIKEFYNNDFQEFKNK